MPETRASSWGLTPEQAMALVRTRYWDNRTVLKNLLMGEKNFPLHIPLKPPSGTQALADLAHLQYIVEAWKHFPQPELLQWKSCNFRQLGQQELPSRLTIATFQQLAALLGEDALAQCERWQCNMQPVLEVNSNRNVYLVLVRHLETLESLSPHDAILLAQVLPQLQSGLGAGGYLRALPLRGVDTKFLESNLSLIEALLDTCHSGAVTEAGGLYLWLNCRHIPRGLASGVPLVRPLCRHTRQQFQMLPLFQLPGDVLREYELPAPNILVVENLQSGLALPELTDTIAVIGGGRNVAWMDAGWLTSKRVAYWGDIDTWGLSILSDAREKLRSVKPLMMDFATLNAHEERMVPEQEPVLTTPAYLTGPEMRLFHDLRDGRFPSTRLEQERLSADAIKRALDEWSGHR